ncbi:SagB-type dehydrogenase family enzyme [Saccharothrix tamanrassetensis]|uniref:SagB-type dehydrogenase family enzyme n=1 Tax=Saccharothrix tamanrassetensis TaxID=1051531 RepID=A0A841CJE3_9PSEU|nr:SagB family peptide dehydrogenase [Saccharothrix tamanrassetensis]MBB5956298.1 SagB-type dehydrogenase family enzyme [Saccharothrix tamanrassetensis]
MRVKVAEHAALFYQDGAVVWDDYLHHRQFAISETAELLCRKFTEFTDVDALLAPLGEADQTALRKVLDELVDAGVLLVEGSPRHEAERRMLAGWGAWGASARHFHFASRTLGDAPYLGPDEHDAVLDAKLTSEPPPAPFRTSGGPAVPLPPLSDDPSWGTSRLLDVLLSRRTTREFGPGPVGLGQVGELLGVLGAPSPARSRIGRSGTVFKTSPSGGGRHPVEIYAHVRGIDGLTPGWHHYDGLAHALEPLDVLWSAEEMAEAAGDQDWVGQAPLVLAYTAVLERTRWRYDTSRAYRVVQMDVGHLSQTAYLVATAMGFGIGFTAALRDELVEQALRCDPYHEVVLGMSAMGPLPQ